VRSIVIIRKSLFPPGRYKWIKPFGNKKVADFSHSESFIAQYFPKMMIRATNYTQAVPVNRQTTQGKSDQRSLLD
jgi:hypothetical protein